MKQHENGKETHYSFVGNTDCNLSAASCSLITVEGKRRLKLQDIRILRRFGETDGNVAPKSDLVKEEHMWKGKTAAEHALAWTLLIGFVSFREKSAKVNCTSH
jgi:hypothetical protein